MIGRHVAVLDRDTLRVIVSPGLHFLVDYYTEIII